jgi:hypothetical protein
VAIPWHRIFGMALTQYFAGTSWQVEVEVDLSVQQQRLDIVILHRTGESVEPVWPDGFGVPAPFNVLTFKATKDPLNAWALKELAAHGVYYRKLRSPNLDDLLPQEHFRLVAASMQFPRQLASQITLQPQGPGAYDVQWGTDVIRVLVLKEMPEAEQNVVWNLFSGEQERIARTVQQLKPRLRSWSGLLDNLLNFYGLEGIAMPYTMEDLEREVEERVLNKLTPEKALSHLSLEQLMERLSPEQRLKGLSMEEIEDYLNALKAAKQKTSREEPKP